MAAPNTQSPPQPESLEAKLGDVYTAGRTDLEINRQLHDGEPIYVLHDPQGFQAHRFSLGDYRVFCSLRDDIPLAKVFAGLVDNGILVEENKEDFYRFIVALRMLNLLKHSEASSKELYEKNRRAHDATKQGGLMRLMSIKVPLVNPDAFLTRTIPFASVFFTRWFACLWLVGGIFALLTLARRASDFAEPLNGILAAGNIPYFLFSLIGLKIWHELGHGYACKRFGGRVPEMGTILMMGMPLAYVDASATWSLKSKRQRLIVMLGGMYFESMLAILSVFIWAAAGHTFVGACAYQTIITASVVTVLFNANPLMRYDGYFVMVELLGLTNLRQVATAEMKAWSKRWFLGIRPNASSDPKTWSRFAALAYAVASGIYTNMLALGIATVLAYKMPQFGLPIAGYYLFNAVGKKLIGLAKYLHSSEEAKKTGLRARVVLVGGFVALPILIGIFPAPTSSKVMGLLSAEHEERVRSRVSGIFQRSLVQLGDAVQPGTAVVNLQNAMIESELHAAKADVHHMKLVRDSFFEQDHSKYIQLTHAVDRSEHKWRDKAAQIDDLAVRTTSAGIVADYLKDNQVGRMVEVGEVVCTVVGGQARLRSYLTEEQLLLAKVEPGTSVTFCFAGQAATRYTGKIIEYSQASVNEFEDTALTQAGGESILIDTATGTPIDKMYLIEIDASNVPAEAVEYGRRATIRFQGKYEPLAWYVLRRINDFSARLNL
jgi:putative peptide zinc metalloprotease protein